MQNTIEQNETWKPTGYDYVVATIRGYDRCARWKDLDIDFGEEFGSETLSEILDFALKRGDLVKASNACVCAPENAERLHLANSESDEDEWDYYDESPL
jgi:hypothetical protein